MPRSMKLHPALSSIGLRSAISLGSVFVFLLLGATFLESVEKEGRGERAEALLSEGVPNEEKEKAERESQKAIDAPSGKKSKCFPPFFDLNPFCVVFFSFSPFLHTHPPATCCCYRSRAPIPPSLSLVPIFAFSLSLSLPQRLVVYICECV